MGAQNSNPPDLEQFATSEYYLGGGASGNVYGPIPYNDIQIALKTTMFADGEVTDEFKKKIEAKKGIWTSLQHKHLVQIHEVQLNKLPKVMFIAMEFAGGGSLCKTLRSLESGKKLPIHVVTNWAKQIAEGMLYMHQKKIVHRDLKSSNILLMKPFDIRNPYVITTLKIADFDDIKEHDHTTTMSGLVGTLPYMAPEVLRYQKFSKTSDVWSYGVVIWEMLSGDIPYKDLEKTAIIYRSQTGELSTLPVAQSFPGQYKLLLNRCWESECMKRPSFLEIFFTIQRWDDFPERYKWDPVLIATVRTKATADGNKLILGLAILDKELFVGSEDSSEIEVYDSVNLTFSRELKIMGTFHPCDIGSSRRSKCLYILNRIVIGHSYEILTIDRNGRLLKKWSTGKDCGRLFVTDESSVILAASIINKFKLNEYLPDGQCIREIKLSPGIGFLWHAIKLTNGHFLVSQGYRDDDEHTVSLVNDDGNVLKSYDGNGGSDIGHMFRPIYLCVDGNGSVLVADHGNSRVLLLDSNLEFKREILSATKHGLRQPREILLDESCGRMLVVNNERKQILVFQFCQ